MVVLMTASPPAALARSHGPDAEALERTRQELARIRKRLAEAKGRAAEIGREVRALDGQIQRLSRQIRVGERDISMLESDIRSAEAGITEMEQRYAGAQRASNERARRIYKAGPSETLDRLLTARSLAEFARMLVWWGVASEMDGKVMLDAARLKADLAERRQDLEAERAELHGQKGRLVERRQLLASARGERDAALRSVQTEIAEDERHVRELEQQSRELTARLREANLSRAPSGAVSRAGFIWPLNGRVTSEYGRRSGGFHSGMDIAGNTGDPIRAAKAGSVVGVQCGSGYGICTIVDHGGGVVTLYAHMSRKSVGGGTVEQGQVIGYVGCTGSCTGPHLHFEVRVNGEPENPRRFLP